MTVIVILTKFIFITKSKINFRLIILYNQIIPKKFICSILLFFQRMNKICTKHFIYGLI